GESRYRSASAPGSTPCAPAAARRGATASGPGDASRSRADRGNRTALRSGYAQRGHGEIRWRYLPSCCRTYSMSPRTGRLHADGFLGFSQDPAQDVHFHEIGLAAPVQTTQTGHQLPWMLRVKEADFNQHLLQMLVEQLH